MINKHMKEIKALNYIYTQHSDTLTINGIDYDGELFRSLANTKAIEVTINKNSKGVFVINNDEAKAKLTTRKAKK